MRYFIFPILILGVGVILTRHILMVALPPELMGLPVPMLAFAGISLFLILSLRSL